MNTSKENKKELSDDRPVKMTKTLMDQYREFLENRACGTQTIQMYFCYLNRLYAFLPEEKELTEENLKGWVASLKDKEYSDRTINMHISSVNGLLRFCGRRNMHLSVSSVPRSAQLPQLTRKEYLKLLSFVKKHGSERDYLVIKTLATIDISITELSLLTVEACQKGEIEFPGHQEIRIPDSMKQELLSYIGKNGLTSGSVFLSNRGNPMDRLNITHRIERYGLEAGIEREKCTPRALHDLYERTQEEITQRLLSLHMKEYEKLLKEEQKKVG